MSFIGKEQVTLTIVYAEQQQTVGITTASGHPIGSASKERKTELRHIIALQQGAIELPVWNVVRGDVCFAAVSDGTADGLGLAEVSKRDREKGEYDPVHGSNEQ